MTFTDSVKHYFDLRRSFVKYGAYHRNEGNKWIHIACVPVILSSALPLLSWLKLVRIGSYDVTAADAIMALYTSTFFAMDKVAALLYLPVMGAVWYAGSTFFTANPAYALIAQVVCWTLQFIGHGILEKRKPALMDNLPESLHAAVFFVWLEVLFMLGYRKDLNRELHALVEVEAAKLNAKDLIKKAQKAH